MTDSTIYIKKISYLIKNELEQGFIPDSDTMHFIKSAYALSEPEEIVWFVEEGLDSGTIAELCVYPSGIFRDKIEPYIPWQGMTQTEISLIENHLADFNINLFISITDRKIPLTGEDSGKHTCKFIMRLNLGAGFNYLETLQDNQIVMKARSILRRKRFVSGIKSREFMTDILKGISADSDAEELIGFAADTLHGSDEDPLEILSDRKYACEMMISEAETFQSLLASYSMEFLMIKRIQPPALSREESVSVMEKIDRLTSAAYGLIIPLRGGIDYWKTDSI